MSSSPEPLPPADVADHNPQGAEESHKITQLKSALWLSVGQLVDEATLQLSKNATPHFIGALTELAWHQVLAAAVDIEAFASGDRHAGRTTVTAEDVVLLARRNAGLKEHLEVFLDNRRREGGRGAGGRPGAASTRGRASGRGRGRGRGR